MKNRSPNKHRDHNVPSGMRVAWKLWRHCCCRNGFYPLIVAPFITASFLLDIYCTIGCGFIALDVGFQPVNEAWSKQKIEIGLFHYQTNMENAHTDPLMNAFHPGCRGYDDLFKEFFMEGDKTWIMSQIMGIVSGCAGGIATMVVWLMVISPIPACFLWPGVLLPASLVAFIGGGAKFLFFDIEVCRSSLWLPEGDSVVPETAESCSFGMDSILSIISSTLSLACVLLVCLKAPKRRELERDLGLAYSDVVGDLQNLRTHTMEDSIGEGSCSFDQDVESQSGRKSAYDLNEIQQVQSNDSRKESLGVMPLYRKSSSSSDIASANSAKNPNPKSNLKAAKKVNKAQRVVDMESEKLRQAEPSVEYTEMELHKMMNTKSNLIPLPETPPTKVLPFKNYVQQSALFANIRQKSSNVSSPGAPSDESSFMFRSPGPLMASGKENSSPRITPRNIRSTPKKKRSGSKKKSIKKSGEKNVKSNKYDEELIQKCVIDLENSFSESDQIPGQDDQIHYR